MFRHPEIPDPAYRPATVEQHERFTTLAREIECALLGGTRRLGDVLDKIDDALRAEEEHTPHLVSAAPARALLRKIIEYGLGRLDRHDHDAWIGSADRPFVGYAYTEARYVLQDWRREHNPWRETTQYDTPGRYHGD